MKIKSLLIGSAAAVAAVSGAKAADPIVIPEPEPMEYVRVCDVYGAGFFYIPGTETCLKISGLIFYQIGATSEGPGDTPNYHGFVEDEYTKYLRARVNFDARSETEWGTLQGYIRYQVDSVNSAISADAPVRMDQGWLSLGGFRAGYSESAFTSTVNGGPTGFGSHSWYGLDYGYSQRQFVQYNFSGGNGFFATVSLENDPASVDKNYIPDVVVKAGVTQGWGGAAVGVGIDEDSSGAGGVVGDAEYAVKGIAHINIPNMPGNSLRVLGFYASGLNSYWDSGEWSVLASYYHTFNPQFGASVGVQYISDTNLSAAGDPNLWLAELNLVWTPVTNFEVRSEITYAKATDPDLDGSVSGFLRFTRYFGD